MAKGLFALDVIVCPACGGRLRLIAALTDPASVRRYRQDGGLPTEPQPLIPPRPHPSKSGTSPHNLILDATSFSVPPHQIASPSKSVYPRPISPYNKPVRPSGRAEPKAGAAQRPAPHQARGHSALRDASTTPTPLDLIT